MPAPLVAATSVAGSSAHAEQAINRPKEMYMGNHKQMIIVLLAGSAVLIFVQHARSGQAQNGKQYIALGIVGFMLLFLAEFAPDVAFALAILFFIGILLNSPNGIPVVSSASKGSK